MYTHTSFTTQTVFSIISCIFWISHEGNSLLDENESKQYV